LKLHSIFSLSIFLLCDVALKPSNNNDSEEEGTRHFMVNVVQPQFNLHSEEANVSKLPLHFFAMFVKCKKLSCDFVFHKPVIIPLQNLSGLLGDWKPKPAGLLKQIVEAEVTLHIEQKYYDITKYYHLIELFFYKGSIYF
jgi:hypothetical protein